jgi:hypothetical protein
VHLNQLRTELAARFLLLLQGFMQLLVGDRPVLEQIFPPIYGVLTGSLSWRVLIAEGGEITLQLQIEHHFSRMVGRKHPLFSATSVAIKVERFQFVRGAGLEHEPTLDPAGS